MVIEIRQIETVIFDWAGTLVDDGSYAPVDALMRVFDAAGLAVTEATCRKPMGLLKRDHIRAILFMDEQVERWRDLFGLPPAEADVERLSVHLEEIMPGVALEHSEPVPGVLDAVTQLRRDGVTIGSTTGYTRRTLDILQPAAAAHGLAVDFAVASDDVPSGRPQPWMILRNLEALGAYPPARVVKVGDTPLDMMEARNAGCIAAGVIYGGNEVGRSSVELRGMPPEVREPMVAECRKRLIDAGAHLVLESLAELPQLLSEGLVLA